MEEQTADLVLVMPMWLSQPWDSKMLSLLTLAPLRIPPGKKANVQVGKVPLPELAPPIAMCHISGSTKRILGKATELLLLR